MIIQNVGVQIPLLGKAQGSLKHLLGVRLEYELFPQTKARVVILAFERGWHIALPQALVLLRTLRKSIIRSFEGAEIRSKYVGLNGLADPEGNQELAARQRSQPLCLGNSNFRV